MYPVSFQFGQYTLTGATLDYDVTFTPDLGILNRYAIRIDELSLYGGNTRDLLSGLINELNQSGQVPIPLPGAFSIPTTLAGTIDLQADPVPVPAAIWLLGSGLMGLIGLRRRQNK